MTVLYRRTRAEMPAIAGEVDAAIEEGVRFAFLAAPAAVERDDEGRVTGLRAQRLRLAEPDASGRRRSEPAGEAAMRLPATAIVVAVSQVPDWSDLEGLVAADGVDADERVLSGGDARGPGIAGFAIAQGRQAAHTLHARLRGLPPPRERDAHAPSPTVKPDFYPSLARTEVPSTPPAERLSMPDVEVESTIDAAAFVAETSRCFSCGQCFGCEHCFTYCNPGGFSRLDEPAPGAYFALSLDRCEACRKCVEVCPCGFLSVEPAGIPPGAVAP